VGLVVWAQIGGGKQTRSETQTCYGSYSFVAAQIRAIIHPITVYPKSKFRIKIPTFAGWWLITEIIQGNK